MICEEAFAFNDGYPGKCFDAKFSKSGWTIGPVGKGTYTFPVYSGSKDCIRNAATLVGQIKFEFTGETARATYIWYRGYKLVETNFYVGDSPYPKFMGDDTVEHGKFTAIHDGIDNDQQDVFNFGRVKQTADGKVYIIAQAKSCAVPPIQVGNDGCKCICPTTSPTTKPPTSPSSPPTSSVPVATPAPVPPVSLPQKCIGYVATWSGDPHMNTFDGLSYDCQGEGEFHVLKSLNSTFELQARFVKFNSNPTPGNLMRPTVTNSIVFNTGDAGQPKIQVNVPDSSVNGCTPYMYVDGVERQVGSDGIGVPSVQVQKVETTTEAGFIIFYHGSKVQLTLLGKKSSSGRCVMSAKICLPFDYDRTDETFVGLLGTPNNDQSDDWMTKTGGKLEVPTSRHSLRFGPAYNFCVQNHCIRDKASSLFKYDDSKKESFEKFMKCDQLAEKSTEQCVLNPPSNLHQVCGNDAACIIDGCVGGVEEAKNFVTSEEKMADKMCGKQVFFEDFSTQPHGDAWGEIYKKDAFTFLHLHKTSPIMQEKFQVPLKAHFIAVEFLFYELGSWEREGAQKDFVYATIGGKTTIDLQAFGDDDQLDAYHQGVTERISWTRRSISRSGDFGMGNKEDQMHKVEIRVPSEFYKDGWLDFKLEVKMSWDKAGESAGVDDFRLTAYGTSCVIPDVRGAPPPMVPAVLPIVCEEDVANAWGDPHFTTFSGFKYDCQGEGEFTLIKAINANQQSQFEVQGRFATFDSRKITVTRAIAIKEEGLPRIQLTVPSAYNQQCPISLFVDGAKRDMFVGTEIDEVIVKQVEATVVIYYPRTRLQVVVMLSKSTKYGCYFSTKVCLPKDYRSGEKIVGLLGTPARGKDGPTIDWMKGDGTALSTSPLTFEKSFRYCVDNWCIRDKSKSVFSYQNGDSFEKFNKCGDIYKGGDVEACINNPPASIKAMCGDDKRCMFEGCAGGEQEAKNALDVEFDMTNEKGCGETVVYVDFEKDDVKDWGLIEKDPIFGMKFLGRFHKSSPPVKKEFDIPEFAWYVTIEFLLLEIDDWARSRSDNKFYVTINDKQFHLETFEDDDSMFSPGNFKSGYKSAIKWKRQAITHAANLGYNEKFKDQIHKVTILVPKSEFTRGKLKLEFDVTLMEDITQVSAGVDELRIVAMPRRCEDAKRKKDEKDGKERRRDSKSGSDSDDRRLVSSGAASSSTLSESDGDSLDNEGDFLGELNNEPALDQIDDTSTPVECRVAFGYHSAKLSGSFRDILGLSSGFEYRNQDISWGWSNGPLAATNYAYSMELYTAGNDKAGEASISVGKMTVEFDGEEAVVSMEAGDRLWLKETKAYVGHTRIPVSEEGMLTIDPEQYPISYDRMATTRTFAVGKLGDKPIYAIAEATVCGVFPSDPELSSSVGVRGSIDDENKKSWFAGLF
jgi:von Willebrand factor type D domain